MPATAQQKTKHGLWTLKFTIYSFNGWVKIITTPYFTYKQGESVLAYYMCLPLFAICFKVSYSDRELHLGEACALNSGWSRSSVRAGPGPIAITAAAVDELSEAEG